jgi:hypothetical protein
MIRSSRSYLSVLFAVISLVLVSSVSAFSQQQASVSNVSIKNFGQMDERFFRGGQPKQDE